MFLEEMAVFRAGARKIHYETKTFLPEINEYSRKMGASKNHGTSF
jgi:hypothetical protein